MKRFDIRTVLRIFFSLSLVAVPALLFTAFLNPEGPVISLVLFTLITNALYFFRWFMNGKKIFSVFLYLSLFIGALVLLIDVVITPYSAYLTWFSIVKEGRPYGAISYIIVMTTVYFTSIVAGGSYDSGFLKPIVTFLFILASIGFLIFPGFLSFMIVVISLGVIIFVIASRGYSGENRLRALGASGIMLLIIFLLAVPMTGDRQPRGSRIVDTSISPMLRDFVVSMFPQFPILYGIPGYGFSFDGRGQGLGRTPVLSQRTIFQVSGTSGKTVYLRTSVQNVYENNSWYASPELVKLGEIGIDVSFSPSPPQKFSDRFEVLVQSDFYAMVPHTLESVSFSMDREKIPDLKYGNKTVGYLLKDPLVSGEVVTVYEDASVRESKDNLQDAEYYLILPEKMPSRMVQLAGRLRRNGVYETAEAIRTHLADSYLYTLSTEQPGNRDMVDYFLFESEKGYCVHFASAFIELARLNGIPSRYATGFLARIPTDGAAVRISGYSAHAWPEIWIKGMGWIIVEATPPVLYSDQSYDEYGYERYGYYEDEYTSRQLRALIGSSPQSLSGGTAGRTQGSLSGGITVDSRIWIIAAVVLLTGALGTAVYFRLHLFSSPHERIVFILKRFVRKLERAGIAHPSRIGWIRWGEEILNRLPPEDQERPDVSGFTDFITVFFFGNHVPDKKDIERVEFHTRAIESRRLKNYTVNNGK